MNSYSNKDGSKSDALTLFKTAAIVWIANFSASSTEYYKNFILITFMQTVQLPGSIYLLAYLLTNIKSRHNILLPFTD